MPGRSFRWSEDVGHIFLFGMVAATGGAFMLSLMLCLPILMVVSAASRVLNRPNWNSPQTRANLGERLFFRVYVAWWLYYIGFMVVSSYRDRDALHNPFAVQPNYHDLGQWSWVILGAAVLGWAYVQFGRQLIEDIHKIIAAFKHETKEAE